MDRRSTSFTVRLGRIIIMCWYWVWENNSKRSGGILLFLSVINPALNFCINAMHWRVQRYLVVIAWRSSCVEQVAWRFHMTFSSRRHQGCSPTCQRNKHGILQQHPSSRLCLCFEFELSSRNIPALSFRPSVVPHCPGFSSCSPYLAPPFD